MVGLKRNYGGMLRFQILLCLWLGSYLASVVWVCTSRCVSGQFLGRWLLFITLHILPVCCDKKKNTTIWEHLPIGCESARQPQNCSQKRAGVNFTAQFRNECCCLVCSHKIAGKKVYTGSQSVRQGSMSHTSPTHPPSPTRVCTSQRSNQALSCLDLCFPPLVRAFSSRRWSSRPGKAVWKTWGTAGQ